MSCTRGIGSDMLVAFLIIAWVAVGIPMTIYWWTDVVDLDLSDLPIIIFVGALLGPLSILFFGVTFLENKDITLIPKRKGKK